MAATPWPMPLKTALAAGTFRNRSANPACKASPAAMALIETRARLSLTIQAMAIRAMIPMMACMMAAGLKVGGICGKRSRPTIMVSLNRPKQTLAKVDLFGLKPYVDA